MSYLLHKKQVIKECDVINIITYVESGQDFLKNVTTF